MSTQEARFERSESSTISQHPIVFTAAVLLGAAIVGGAVMLLGFFSDSEEAPIRVKNGSLELIIVSASQQWQQAGSSGNWRIANAERYSDNYEVTAAVKAGATCGGSTTATGSDVVFTYSDGKVIRVQSTGNRTAVKPDAGATMTWDAATPQKLSYVATGGYLATIAVGNGANPTTMCTFTAANQLDHVLLLNVP